MGSYQTQVFFGDIADPGPREAAPFLQVGSGLQMQPSAPLRRQSSTTVTLLSFLAEAVSRYGDDHLALGPLLDRFSLTSSLTSPSISSSPNLLLRGTWGSWVGRLGVHPWRSEGTFLPTLIICQVNLTVTRQGVHHFQGVPPLHPSLQHTSESLYQSVSCSHSQMVSLSPPPP